MRVLVVSLLPLLVFSIRSSHQQKRQLICDYSAKDGTRIECSTRIFVGKGKDGKELLESPHNCFEEKTQEGETRIYCPLFCPGASSVFIGSKKPPRLDDCINFNNYQVEHRDGEWLLWRSGRCSTTPVLFDVGCTFDYNQGAADVEFYLRRKVSAL